MSPDLDTFYGINIDKTLKYIQNLFIHRNRSKNILEWTGGKRQLSNVNAYYLRVTITIEVYERSYAHSIAAAYSLKTRENSMVVA